MAGTAQRLSQMAHRALVLCHLERATRGGSLLEQALKIRLARPAKLGRNACSTLLIVDAQSVKNTDTAGLKGYDAGKKVSGIKRHIAVDTQGLPHAIAVTTAG